MSAVWGEWYIIASPVHSTLPVEGKGLVCFKIILYHAKQDILSCFGCVILFIPHKL